MYVIAPVFRFLVSFPKLHTFLVTFEERGHVVLPALITVALAAGSAVAQDAPSTVQITGAVKQSLTLTAEDLGKMPRATVRTSRNGLETVYEGVWLHDVLKQAGVPLGTELRGKALASYLVAEAKDGYQVVFSVAEVDPAFTDDEMLLADKVDGKPLLGSQGPFRLVVAKDKPGERSIRMLTKIEVVQLRK
jgi:DMSO/TMAO reductase YedYZ molybdopterin-dependent catalytic subunit